MFSFGFQTRPITKLFGNGTKIVHGRTKHVGTSAFHWYINNQAPKIGHLSLNSILYFYGSFRVRRAQDNLVNSKKFTFQLFSEGAGAG